MVSPDRRGLTPDEWVDARSIETAYNNQPPNYEKPAAKRLMEDCVKAGYVSHGKPDAISYLKDYASNNPVPRANHKNFSFWAFKSSPGAPNPDIGSHFQAKACAKTRGYQVLSETIPGERLDSYRLHDRKLVDHLERGYGISPDDLEPARDKAWNELSASMAQAANGKVRVIAPDMHPSTVLARTEIPTLAKNPGVGLENIKFVTEFPEHPHLPKNVNKFLSHDLVRAQVTLDHYAESGPGPKVLADSKLPASTPPPHALAHKLDSITLPPHLQTERDKVSASLRSATSYKDLKASAPTPSPTPPSPPSAAHAGAAMGPGTPAPSGTTPTSKAPAPTKHGSSAMRNRLTSLARRSPSPSGGTTKLPGNRTPPAPSKGGEGPVK